ncbi:glycosyltransferase family 4 protein [Sphingobium sp. D43FB]|uniref:glycosyltransferase family 4 protein n=1 Tax=Sphingobium sp. D43FB TaxID=2017595 RepID=UPI000BB57803|nr:glycosyltransferase family 4 protein [Sphingobium sp. D43FB]PBN41620.1 glycosyl transferase [Sphingobium sp. D43FB]
MSRLLNINNYHYRRGGAEAVYLDHGALFANDGWDIDWFSMRHPQNLPGTDETYFADLIDLEYMQGKVSKAKSAAAIIYNGNARSRLHALIGAARPDVAHLHNIYHHLSPSILGALKAHDIPAVLTAHDLKLVCPSYKMLSGGKVCERCKGGKLWNVAVHRCMKGSMALSSLIAVESTVHRLAGLYRNAVDRVVAPSRFYRDKLIEWGWDADKVIYIPNFVRARPRRAPVKLDGAVLYFGRLSEEKGLATLIRAAAMTGVAVNIAGTGPCDQEFRALAQNLNAPVTFLGYRTGAALEQLLDDARAIVLPSEWYENAPMSVIEAYNAGRPVLGADIGGIPEMIDNGVTGWTFPSRDVEALASKLEEISATPVANLEAMGRAGGMMVAEHLSAARYYERMSDVYRQLGVAKSTTWRHS